MSLFSRDTVESIISDITDKIEKLHLVAELKAAEAEAHDAVVSERQKLAADARAVVAKAKAIAGKFTSLVEGDL